MKIFYAGHAEQKEHRGLVFPRLSLVDIPADLANTLLTDKPRTFFMQGEVPPRETLAERFSYFKNVIAHAEVRAEQYFTNAAQYTDAADLPKKKGALDEYKLANTEIEEAEQQLAALLSEFSGKTDDERIEAAIDSDLDIISIINGGSVASVAPGVNEQKVIEEAFSQIKDLKSQLAQVADLKKEMADMVGLQQQLGALQELQRAQLAELEELRAKNAEASAEEVPKTPKK